MEKEENVFSFEKLVVYQRSLDFLNHIYDVTLKFPRNERFTLVDQFRRAAISIRECVALITIARARNYIDIKKEQELRGYCAQLSRMLSGLIRSLTRPTHNPGLTTHNFFKIICNYFTPPGIYI